jgi:flagellar biogenesis protein FliO
MTLTAWIPFALVVGGLVLAGTIAVRVLPLLTQKGRTDRLLKHLGTLSLTPQCSVALVRVGGETLVLGVTPQSVSLLARTAVTEAALSDAAAEPAMPPASRKAAPQECGGGENASPLRGAA